MQIDEDNFDIIKKVLERTGTDYEIYWRDAENIDGYISANELLGMVEDLLCEIDNLEEKIEDIKQDIHDNYKRMTIEEQVE